MSEDNEITYVHLAKKIAAIKSTDWNYDFNPDEILKTDPFNIFGEIITIPVFVNRMGVIVAEMAAYVKEQKTRLGIKEAEVSKLFRNKEVGEGRKKPTIQEVDDYLTLDPVVKNMRLKLIKLEGDLQKLEVMYDAAKDKSYKLNRLSQNLKPEDFEKEIIEGTINGVMITLRDKKFS